MDKHINKHKQILWATLIQHLKNCTPFFDRELECLEGNNETRKQITKKYLYKVWIYSELING